MSPRLLVVDQSLHGFAGHHYDYSRAVLEAAREQSLGVCLATHAHFPADSLAGAPVIGRFAADWGDARRGRIQTRLRSALAQLPSPLRHRLLAFAPRTQPLSAPDRQFGSTLLALISAAKLAPGDHVFIHTLGEAELLGLLDVLRARQSPIAPRLHIVLRYDGTIAYAPAFSGLREVSTRLSFWTDTERLAAHYRGLGCPAIGVLPIPHGLTEASGFRQREGGPLTLAYLGGARRDKGFHRLPDLVDSIAGQELATGRARFLIQSTYAFSREEPLMWRSARRLGQYPRAWVEMIERPLAPEAFAEALYSTDILLLPYDAEIYRRRSSGLLVQAMVTGIPTVVPQDTWLAEEAPATAHITFGGDNDLAGAARQAIAAYEALSTAAIAAAPMARAEHDVARLVKLLIRPTAV